MKIKESILIILVAAIVFIFLGCTNNSVSGISLNAPDKINIYANGGQKQITKIGDKYDQTLFNRINVLVNIRLPKEFSIMQGIISQKDIEEAKKYAVEFVYDKTQMVTIDNGNKEKIQFTEILFPLNGTRKNIAFLKTKDNNYIGVGLKENLDYLVKASVR